MKNKHPESLVFWLNEFMPTGSGRDKFTVDLSLAVFIGSGTPIGNIRFVSQGDSESPKATKRRIVNRFLRDPG